MVNVRGWFTARLRLVLELVLALRRVRFRDMISVKDRVRFKSVLLF